MLAPRTVKLTDPDAAKLVAVIKLTLEKSKVYPLDILSDRRPRERMDRILPFLPAKKLLLIEVSEDQDVLSQVENANRSEAVCEKRPKFEPKAVTLTDPVPGSLDLKTEDMKGELAEIADEILPKKRPKVIITRTLPTFFVPVWHSRAVSDAQDVR